MVKPIRILHVIGSLALGGIQSYLMELYRHVDKTQIQFDFVVHIKTEQSYASEINSFGGKVFYIDNDVFERKKWLQYLRFWNRFFKRHSEYRIVHGHIRSTSAIYLYAAKKNGCYTIAHSHATSNGYGITAMVKDLLQFPSRFIADYCMGCSTKAVKWMFGNRRANSKTCRVIKNGIDLNKFLYNSAIRSQIRKQHNLADEIYVFGTVGRLVEQKNQELLIRVFAKSCETRDKIALLIIGDGPLFDYLYHLIRKLGVEDKVALLGSRTDVHILLQAFDCFVMPSRDEGLGISVIEAQAADLPVIVSPAITEEACITNNIIYTNSYDEKEWSDIFVRMERKRRANREADIRKAGYDICEVAESLCRFYFEHC